jgi:hypothetical protein
LAGVADITVSMADTTAIGGAAQGVLGLTELGGTVTLVSGWDWYAGADPTQIASNQFDFATVATHELGHSLGFGHSAERASVMYPYLSRGEVRHDLTAGDITLISQYTPGQLSAMSAAMTAEALMASPSLIAAPPSAVWGHAFDASPANHEGLAVLQAPADAFFNDLGQKHGAAAHGIQLWGSPLNAFARRSLLAVDSVLADDGNDVSRSKSGEGPDEHLLCNDVAADLALASVFGQAPRLM